MKPFVVESNEQFLSKGPNALTSGLYAKEYNEVKVLGVLGLERTGEQLAVFNFFQANPVEMFSRSFRTHALAQGLGLVEQARLFGLFGLAGGDTNITCWEDKAHWSFWRPQTAIRLADTDGNPKTEKVDGWTSAIATPPYPDHSSGYNCNTGIYMTIAELYFGQGRTNFTVSNLNGTTREYDHFRDVWADTIDARVYQGIHFRSPDEAGGRSDGTSPAGSRSTLCKPLGSRCGDRAVEYGGDPRKRVSSRTASRPDRPLNVYAGWGTVAHPLIARAREEVGGRFRAARAGATRPQPHEHNSRGGVPSHLFSYACKSSEAREARPMPTTAPPCGRRNRPSHPSHGRTPPDACAHAARRASRCALNRGR